MQWLSASDKKILFDLIQKKVFSKLEKLEDLRIVFFENFVSKLSSIVAESFSEIRAFDGEDITVFITEIYESYFVIQVDRAFTVWSLASEAFALADQISTDHFTIVFPPKIVELCVDTNPAVFGKMHEKVFSTVKPSQKSENAVTTRLNGTLNEDKLNRGISNEVWKFLRESNLFESNTYQIGKYTLQAIITKAVFEFLQERFGGIIDNTFSVNYEEFPIIKVKFCPDPKPCAVEFNLSVK